MIGGVLHEMGLTTLVWLVLCVIIEVRDRWRKP